MARWSASRPNLRYVSFSRWREKVGMRVARQHTAAERSPTIYPPAVTRQITSPTSSAISNERPSAPNATPTGRP